MYELYQDTCEMSEYSLRKDDDLYEGNEAEYQQSASDVASKTIVHLLGILSQE